MYKKVNGNIRDGQDSKAQIPKAQIGQVFERHPATHCQHQKQF